MLTIEPRAEALSGESRFNDFSHGLASVEIAGVVDAMGATFHLTPREATPGVELTEGSAGGCFKPTVR